jgi:hypothetical protein
MSRRSRHSRPLPSILAGEPMPVRSRGLSIAAAAVTMHEGREPLDRVRGALEPADAADAPDIMLPPEPAAPAVISAPTSVGVAGAGPVGGEAPGDGPRTTCTQAQLRRFIKSRPWIPMHELRRRFGIAGGDDDVTPVRTPDGTIFVGLPSAEGSMLGELLNSGDVGYELSLDPGAPIVVGVYPMRPVPRG